MSHRITSQEAEGRHIRAFWEDAVEALQEVDEGLPAAEPRPLRLHEMTDEQFRLAELG